VKDGGAIITTPGWPPSIVALYGQREDHPHVLAHFEEAKIALLETYDTRNVGSFLQNEAFVWCGKCSTFVALNKGNNVSSFNKRHIPLCVDKAHELNALEPDPLDFAMLFADLAEESQKKSG